MKCVGKIGLILINILYYKINDALIKIILKTAYKYKIRIKKIPNGSKVKPHWRLDPDIWLMQYTNEYIWIIVTWNSLCSNSYMKKKITDIWKCPVENRPIFWSKSNYDSIFEFLIKMILSVSTCSFSSFVHKRNSSTVFIDFFWK